MNTHVNIFAADWCDLVFENKNKNYGAFELRQMSAKRHVLAIFLSIALFAMAVSVPFLIKAFNPPKIDPGFTETTVITDIPAPQKDVIKPAVALPAPKLRSTVRFVPPVITNNPVSQEDLASMETILNTNVAIGMRNFTGSSDPEAVIADEFPGVTEDKDKTWIHVDQMPEFPGGEPARIKFLRDNLKYPVIATEMGITGRVILQFVVSETGKIDKITVLRGAGSGLDEEAVRVAKLMPVWKPGKQNGKAVKVFFTFPVVFAMVEQ